VPRPGYVGHEQGGRLTEAVRRQPFTVVLLDEIEKAHPDIYNTFLQVLDDGRLTDGLGRTVDFRRVILIMTSNTGFNRGAGVGFQGTEQRDVDAPLKTIFSPEFLDRLDEVVAFERFDKRAIVHITNAMLDDIRVGARDARRRGQLRSGGRHLPGRSPAGRRERPTAAHRAARAHRGSALARAARARERGPDPRDGRRRRVVFARPVPIV
jgi:hypothetical protein